MLLNSKSLMLIHCHALLVCVPHRLAGHKPKCFFSLLKSFIGTRLMGYPAEPKHVHQQLKNNLGFVKICGFVPKKKIKVSQYQASHVPKLRKIEQFDRVSEYRQIELTS